MFWLVFSVVFGILKTTGGATDWNEVSDGNKIQVFAQILYGYGYWGPFALDIEFSYLTCNSFNFDEALEEYSDVTNYNRASLNPVIASYFTTELNGKIKENLYCLVRIIISLTFMVCTTEGSCLIRLLGLGEKSH